MTKFVVRWQKLGIACMFSAVVSVRPQYIVSGQVCAQIADKFWGDCRKLVGYTLSYFSTAADVRKTLSCTQFCTRILPTFFHIFVYKITSVKINFSSFSTPPIITTTIHINNKKG